MDRHAVGSTARDPASMHGVGWQTPPTMTTPPTSTTASCVTRPNDHVTITARGRRTKAMMMRGHPCSQPRRCPVAAGRAGRTPMALARQVSTYHDSCAMRHSWSGAVSRRPWRHSRWVQPMKNRVEVGGRRDGRWPFGIRVIRVSVRPATSLGAPHRTASGQEGGSVGGEGGCQPRRWAATRP